MKTNQYTLAVGLGLIAFLSSCSLWASTITTYDITGTLPCTSGPCPTDLSFAANSTITIDDSTNLVMAAAISIAGAVVDTPPNIINVPFEYTWLNADFYVIELFTPNEGDPSITTYDASVWFAPPPGDIIWEADGTYQLSTPAGAPEPGTGLLFGTLAGLLGIELRRKRFPYRVPWP